MAAPDGQLFNPPSVSGLVSISYETSDDCIIRKLKDFNRGDPGGVVVSVQGGEQWRKHAALWRTFAGWSGVGCVFPQPHLLLPISEEAGKPLTDGTRHSELGGLWSSSGMTVLSVELKSKNRIYAYVSRQSRGAEVIPMWLCCPPTCWPGRWTAGGPIRGLWWFSGELPLTSQSTSWLQGWVQQICSHLVLWRCASWGLELLWTAYSRWGQHKCSSDLWKSPVRTHMHISILKTWLMVLDNTKFYKSYVFI